VPPLNFLAQISGAMCVVRKALMVTVEVDPERVESQLQAARCRVRRVRTGRWSGGVSLEIARRLGRASSTVL